MKNKKELSYTDIKLSVVIDESIIIFIRCINFHFDFFSRIIICFFFSVFVFINVPAFLQLFKLLLFRSDHSTKLHTQKQNYGSTKIYTNRNRIKLSDFSTINVILPSYSGSDVQWCSFRNSILDFIFYSITIRMRLLVLSFSLPFSTVLYATLETTCADFTFIRCSVHNSESKMSICSNGSN